MSNNSLKTEANTNTSTTTTTTTTIDQSMKDEPTVSSSTLIKDDDSDSELVDDSLITEESIVDIDQNSPVKRKPKKANDNNTTTATDSTADNALDRLNQLLLQTEQFSQYIKGGKPSAAVTNNSKSSKSQSSSAAAADASSKRSHTVKSEEEEDNELVEDSEHISDHGHRLLVQPATIIGQMRDYQLEALNWLIRLHDQNINGILADEMGLGKTLESLSLLSYLKAYRNYAGPHLIIVPKSTSGNWMREVTRWTNNLTAHKFHGNQAERELQKLDLGKMDITVTTYEVAIIEKAALRKINWHYLYIDEAHRVKNENSLLAKVVRTFPTDHRLLITGTPLQNNLHELWALLNFLLPKLFDSAADFESWFEISNNADQRQIIVSRLHKLLRPFLLRRLKSEVEKALPPKIETKLFIGLSVMQREWYTKILSRDIEVLNTATNTKMRLMNIVMQLRKVTNHPYLFTGAEPGPPYIEGDHLINNSGKMVLLDKLLTKLEANGHRVLIFSQMTRMLDILEDYCHYRGFLYNRIDGQSNQQEREDSMDAFNAPNSKKFLFMLSTRAGGLGINLQTADTVILFDSDWNPQADLQAMDRAHRIGQKKQVNVYRFVAEDTIEQKMVERATKKLFLDALVIKQGRLANEDKNVSATELQEMVRFGASRIFQSTESTVTDEDIDLILARGQKITTAESDKLKENTNNDLLNFSLTDGNEHNYQSFEGIDYTGMRANNNQSGANKFNFVELPQRSRKGNYNIDAWYRDALRVTEKSTKGKEFKPTQRQDWQFFNVDRLNELEKKEFEGKSNMNKLKEAKRLKKIEDRKQQAVIKREQAAEKRKQEKLAAAADAENDTADAAGADADGDSAMKVDQSTPSNIERKVSGDGTAAAAAADTGADAEADAEVDVADDIEDIEDLEQMEAAAGVLTPIERAELERLESAGFGKWKRQHFMAFVRACEHHGRQNINEIITSEMIPDRTPDEIRAYHQAFVIENKVKELDDYQRIDSQISRGEAKLEKLKETKELLKKKLLKHRSRPYESLVLKNIKYSQQKNWTEDEDRFLVVTTAKHSCYGDWDRLKEEIRQSWLFRFDWFLKSRTTGELSKRVDYLVNYIQKELEEDAVNAVENAKKKALLEKKKLKQQQSQSASEKGKKASSSSATASNTDKSKPKSTSTKSNSSPNKNDKKTPTKSSKDKENTEKASGGSGSGSKEKSEKPKTKKPSTAPDTSNSSSNKIPKKTKPNNSNTEAKPTTTTTANTGSVSVSVSASGEKRKLPSDSTANPSSSSSNTIPKKPKITS